MVYRKKLVDRLDVKAWYKKFESSDNYKNRVLPKIGNILKEHYNQEIEKRIIFDGSQSSIEYSEFNKIKITQRALDKGKYIARSLCDIAKSNYEVYMYLVGNDSVIDDILIGHGQTVWPDLCRMYPLGKVQTSLDIRKMGKKILGWSHSHGGISTFHSGTDVNNLHRFVSGGVKTQIDLHDDDEAIESKLYDVKHTASLVFNKYMWGTDDMPFSGVAMSYTGYGGRDINYHINERVNVDVVPSEPFLESEYKGIDEQIIDRVTLYDKGPLKEMFDNVSHSDVKEDRDVMKIIEDYQNAIIENRRDR